MWSKFIDYHTKGKIKFMDVVDVRLLFYTYIRWHGERDILHLGMNVVLPFQETKLRPRP